MLTALSAWGLRKALSGQSVDPCTGGEPFQTVPANVTVDISTWFPDPTNSTSNKIFQINGTLRIDKSFTFTNCKFRFGANAVVVTSTSGNPVFTAINSQFATCGNYMWNGITVNPGSTISFQSCLIRDARPGLTFPPGYSSTANDLRHTDFLNNLTGIYVGDPFSSNGATVGFTYCYGNQFRQSGTLKSTTTPDAFAGISVQRFSTLTFGSGTGLKNTFDNMQHGIFCRSRSSVTVVNSEFKNMRNVSGDLQNSDGSGIYASGSSLTVTKSEELNCEFNNNRNAGIFVNAAYGPSTIEYASFSGRQDFGIRYKSSPNKVLATIQHNTFTLRRANRFAIYFERPPGDPGSTKSTIYDNDITLTDQPYEACNIGALITVIGNNGAFNTLQIEENRLYNYTQCRVAHGIYVYGQGDNYRVIKNDLYYLADPAYLGTVSPEHAALGIVFTNMPGKGNHIWHNLIRSQLQSSTYNLDYNRRSFIKCAVHVVDCNAPSICDNDVDDTYRGIHFGDLNPATLFALNDFKRHVFAFFCGKSAAGAANTDIDNQVLQGNVWSTDPADYVDQTLGGVGAKYADAADVPFDYFYHPTLVTSGHIPLSADPTLSDWFLPLEGDQAQCGINHVGISGLDIDVAKGTYASPNPAATWDMQRQLWYKLTRDPQLADDDPDVFSFYTSTNGSSPQRYAAAFYQFEQAFLAPANVSAQLDSLYTLYAALQTEIRQAEAQISQDTVNLNGTAAATLAAKVSQLAAANQFISSLLDTYAATRNTALQTLQTTVNNLPINEYYEAAWLNILNAGIKIGQEQALSSQERATLIVLAEACAADVGVSRQIVLAFMPIEDSAPYLGREGDAGCTARSTPLNPSLRLTLLPNPAQDRIRVLLPPDSAAGAWTLWSVAGQYKQQGLLAPKQSAFDLDLSAFESGMYLLEIKQSAYGRQTAKFSIVK